MWLMFDHYTYPVNEPNTFEQNSITPVKQMHDGLEMHNTVLLFTFLLDLWFRPHGVTLKFAVSINFYKVARCKLTVVNGKIAIIAFELWPSMNAVYPFIRMHSNTMIRPNYDKIKILINPYELLHNTWVHMQGMQKHR